MRVVQRSVKSVSLRHSKSRTLVSVSTSPSRVPVTCRATSGAQSAWSSGLIVLHQTRTAPSATTKTTNMRRRKRPKSAMTVARPSRTNKPPARPLTNSGAGRRYHSASPRPSRCDGDSEHKNGGEKIRTTRRNPAPLIKSASRSRQQVKSRATNQPQPQPVVHYSERRRQRGFDRSKVGFDSSLSAHAPTPASSS